MGPTKLIKPKASRVTVPQTLDEMNMINEKRARVFLNVRVVRKRDNTAAYSAEWVARGGGTILYASSRPDIDRARVVRLAHAWLAKNTDRVVDTTETRGC